MKPILQLVLLVDEDIRRDKDYTITHNCDTTPFLSSSFNAVQSYSHNYCKDILINWLLISIHVNRSILLLINFIISIIR
jgi:hypothetical protein